MPLDDHGGAEADRTSGDAAGAATRLCRLAPDELERRARAIDWLVLDVDGVLTTGLVS